MEGEIHKGVITLRVAKALLRQEKADNARARDHAEHLTDIYAKSQKANEKLSKDNADLLKEIKNMKTANEIYKLERDQHSRFSRLPGHVIEMIIEEAQTDTPPPLCRFIAPPPGKFTKVEFFF